MTRSTTQRSAGEFLAVMTAEVIGNADKVLAVMVITAYAPLDPRETQAPVALAAWGGTIAAQAQLLRDLAARLEREAADPPMEESRTVQ